MILALVVSGGAIAVATYAAYVRWRTKRRLVRERMPGPGHVGAGVVDEGTTSIQIEPPRVVKDTPKAPSIEAESPSPDGHTSFASLEVEAEARHTALPLTPVAEAPAEAHQPVTVATETTAPPKKERDRTVASDEAAREVPPETPPTKEPAIEDRKADPSLMEASEDGESECATVKDAKPRREQAPVCPEDRGGRSRETVPQKDGGSEKKRRSRTPKPEVVCWKREREWILAVELPDGFVQNQQVLVVQGDKALEKDETDNDCWCLAQLHGEIIVRVTDADNERVFTLPLGDDDYLIFKLSGDDRGRHVKCPGSGSCLAIVPEDWKRDEALTGPPRIAPEDVCLSGYRAHFFEL